MDITSGEQGVNILDPRLLLEMAKDSSREGRNSLAAAISAFFDEHELSQKEQSLAGGILMSLIRQAETDLRQALAERLAVQDNVPFELVAYLANDDIAVAQSVLLNSPVLKDIDLIHVIDRKGTEHWQAIAQRANLTPLVIDKLVDTHDTSTVLNLIDNQRVHLQRGSLKKIIRVSMTSEVLQAPLLRRPEISSDIATDLYMVVSNDLRRAITEKFSIDPRAIERTLDYLVQELACAARGDNNVTDEMRALARRFHARDEISVSLMTRTLRRGQMGFFVALFAERLGFSPDLVLRMIRKDNGKPFVMACRFLGMEKSEFASIFLLSRGIRTGDKIVDQRELAMALKDFDTLKDFDVGRIVKRWSINPELI